MMSFYKALNHINVINVYENSQTRLYFKNMQPIKGD